MSWIVCVGWGRALCTDAMACVWRSEGNRISVLSFCVPKLLASMLLSVPLSSHPIIWCNHWDYRAQTSIQIFTQSRGFKFRSLYLHSNHFYPGSHFPSPTLNYFKIWNWKVEKGINKKRKTNKALYYNSQECTSLWTRQLDLHIYILYSSF